MCTTILTVKIKLQDFSSHRQSCLLKSVDITDMVQGKDAVNKTDIWLIEQHNF